MRLTQTTVNAMGIGSNSKLLSACADMVNSIRLGQCVNVSIVLCTK